MTSTATRETLAVQMEANGFEIGKPAHVCPDVVAIDRETAAEATCSECSHHGLEFVPYRRRDRRMSGYRCIAWCSCCDAAFEF